MRIAQVAPLAEAVPPKFYGGTERVVSWLTEELVEMGHEVTLFASGDSITNAVLEACSPRALRLHGAARDWNAYHAILLGRLMRRARDFDVIHFHIDWLHLPVCRALPGVAHLTTCHGRLDWAETGLAFHEFGEAPFVSISA